MLDGLMKKLARFLSIAGGVSSSEDIARAKQRNFPHEPVKQQAVKAEAQLPPKNGSVK